MKKAKTIMIQGTASAVGKSLIATALCRIFKQDGYRVAPFKSQNMALNSFVTMEGGEMGRAQVVQAEAAGITPTVDMNPVLLKPASNSGCQVVVMGKVFKTVNSNDYYLYTPSLLETVAGALERLRDEYDIVVIEGAGSPAEINLKDKEIANMRTAKMAGAPVLLVGDIDKGGVYASLVGTMELLDEDERHYVKGFIINKFRGDVDLIRSANESLEKRTGRPVLGVVPYSRDIRIAQEDSVYLDERKTDPAAGNLEIAVIRLPHISNFDDFDPFEMEGCSVSYGTMHFELSKPHLIIIPGTKSTIADIEYLRYSGLAAAITSLAKAGTPVMGICGGYQILGQKILDPQKIESKKTEVAGLGLLDVVTEYADEKSTRQVKAQVQADTGLLAGMKGLEVGGYEIHMGQTRSPEENSVLKITATPRGAAEYFDGNHNPPGTIMGTYLHGLFYNDELRQKFLNNLRRYWKIAESPEKVVPDKEQEYNKLAALVRGSLNMTEIYRILEEGL